MSWRLRIRHATGYRYDKDVISSYNEARLTPQTENAQLTLESRVTTVPEARQYRYWDYWGTQVTAFDVQEAHTELEVTSQSVVDTAHALPVPVGGPGWEQLRAPAQQELFAELLTPTTRTVVEPDMAAASREAAGSLPPHEALFAVTQLVHDRVSYQTGATGVQTSAPEAWHLGRGVCQDIAHVSLALLRELGLPARYVSGYLHPEPAQDIGTPVSAESHAWIEVWLGSWWAYDPTSLSVPGDRHVLVARGREYGDVTPLKGIYSGSGSHALGVKVELTRLM